MRSLWIALRPTHWIKNLLLFLPLTFGGKLFSSPNNLLTLAAFAIFSAAASASYLFNDLIDLKRDRLDPIKRLRPLAARKITPSTARNTACLLVLGSITCAFLLETTLGWLISGYLILTLIYSRILKELVILDVFAIGLFFFLRIAAGSVVAQVELSHWIVLMCIFLALFLGFSKRRQELVLLGSKARAHRAVLSRYSLPFVDQMVAVITSSIVIFYALYTVDARTIAHVGSQHLSYSIPFVYYGIFRYLYITTKLRKSGDPVRILLADRGLQVNLLLWGVICVAVIYFEL